MKTRIPQIPLSVPRRNGSILKAIGRGILGLLRWEIEGNLPDKGKFVVIAAPHTSNWDFVIGLSAAMALDVEAHWIGKHTIFRWPFGGLMRWLGGIPVNRNTSEGLVDEAVSEINARETFVLGIAPEGTRRSVTRWRSGFYHIALGAGIPIVCAYFDYPSRRIGIGMEIMPTGDFERDLARVHDFYAPFTGKKSGAVQPPAKSAG